MSFYVHTNWYGVKRITGEKKLCAVYALWVVHFLIFVRDRSDFTHFFTHKLSQMSNAGGPYS